MPLAPGDSRDQGGCDTTTGCCEHRFPQEMPGKGRCGVEDMTLCWTHKRKHTHKGQPPNSRSEKKKHTGVKYRFLATAAEHYAPPPQPLLTVRSPVPAGTPRRGAGLACTCRRARSPRGRHRTACGRGPPSSPPRLRTASGTQPGWGRSGQPIGPIHTRTIHAASRSWGAYVLRSGKYAFRREVHARAYLLSRRQACVLTDLGDVAVPAHVVPFPTTGLGVRPASPVPDQCMHLVFPRHSGGGSSRRQPHKKKQARKGRVQQQRAAAFTSQWCRQRGTCCK